MVEARGYGLTAEEREAAKHKAVALYGEHSAETGAAA